MIVLPAWSLVLLAVVLPSPAREASPRASLDAVQDERATLKEQYRRKLGELAKDDVAGHFELALWCEEVGLKGEVKLVLRKVIALDPNHPEARERLGYVQQDGKWVLRDAVEEEKEQEKEEPAGKKPSTEGKVRFKGEWVPAADLPHLEKGLVRRGERWVTPEEAKRIDEGWKFLEGEWWSPEDAANVEKGLLPVNDRWVPKAEANVFHAVWDDAWVLSTANVRLRTNVDRDQAAALAARAEETFERLRALLGASPRGGEVLQIYAFRTDDEYRKYQETHGDEHGLVYGAFLSLRDDPPVGVAAAQKPDWAAYHVAHAVGHLFLRHLAGEKGVRSVPEWLQEGIAGYAEKGYDDHHRKWTLKQIEERGGLEDPAVVAKGFGLSGSDPEGSAKQILQTSLLVAYCVDGGEAVPARVRRAFEAALRGVARGQKQDIKRGVDALLKDPDLEKNVRAFAGLK